MTRPPDPTQTLVLGFDTSADHVAAALLCGDRIVAERYEEMAKGQAECLIPLLEDTLAEAQVTWRDLMALGVGVGPGNFTGIRISVSAARGLALGLNIPAVGITAFQSAAYGMDRPVLAVVPARGSRFFAQRQCDGGAPPESVDLTALPAHLCDPDQRIAGSGPADLADLAHNIPGTWIGQSVPRAAAIAFLAKQRCDSGEPVPAPAPLYVRAADAAPSRDTPPVLLD